MPSTTMSDGVKKRMFPFGPNVLFQFGVPCCHMVLSGVAYAAPSAAELYQPPAPPKR